MLISYSFCTPAYTNQVLDFAPFTLSDEGVLSDYVKVFLATLSKISVFLNPPTTVHSPLVCFIFLLSSI